MSDDLNENLHGADENRRQGLHLLEAAHEDVAVHLVGELFLPGVDFARDAGEARAQILDELHEVLHALDHLGHGEVVEHLLALADDLAHLGLVEAQQQRRGALQDAAGALDQLPPNKAYLHLSEGTAHNGTRRAYRAGPE